MKLYLLDVETEAGDAVLGAKEEHEDCSEHGGEQEAPPWQRGLVRWLACYVDIVKGMCQLAFMTYRHTRPTTQDTINTNPHQYRGTSL